MDEVYEASYEVDMIPRLVDDHVVVNPKNPSEVLSDFLVDGQQHHRLIIVDTDGIVYVCIPEVVLIAIVSEDCAPSFNQALRYVENLINDVESETYQLVHMKIQMHYGFSDSLDPEKTGVLKDYLPENVMDYLDDDISYIILVAEDWHV